MQLKHKLILSFLLFIAIPFLVVGWYSAHQASKVTKEQVSATLYRLGKQNGMTLERTLGNMNDKTLKFYEEFFSTTAAQPIDPKQIHQLEEYNAVSKMIANYTLDGTRYALVVARDSEKQLVALDSGLSSGLIFASREELPPYYDEAVEQRGTGLIRVLPFGETGGSTACYIRAIVDPHDAAQVIGVLYVTQLEIVLVGDIWDEQIPAGGSSYLVNERGDILAAAPEGRVGTSLALPREIAEQRNGYRIADWGGRQVLFTSVYNQRFGTRLIYEIPVEAMVGDQNFYSSVLLTVMALSFVLVLGYLVYLIRLMLRPLNRLSRMTEKYEPGVTFRLEEMLRRNDEIGKMYGSFQRMTERVNQMVEERYLLEMKQQELELMTLHTQITPHLLYNTLDSIYWSAIDKEVPELARLVKDLSSLLRIGLSRGRELVPVSEEIQHIQAYIRLQLERYQHAFQVHWDLDEQLAEEITPKVILQPIAENAILHGIGKMDGEGEMWIRSVCGETTFSFLIEDNGFKPADPEKLHRLMRLGDGEGYGIRNVDRRIKLHYGEGYGIRYSKRPGGGTVACITLPRKAVQDAHLRTTTS